MRDPRSLAALSIPLLLTCLSPAACSAGEDQAPDPWAPLEALVGTWSGTSDGRFGPAELETTWEFVLGGTFLRSTTRSVSAMEVHEDIGLMSYDQERRTFVLREFYSEGYVNRFVVTFDAASRTLRFESESVENGFAPDLHVVKTIVFGDDGTLRSTLALGSEGEPVEECIESELRRGERN